MDTKLLGLMLSGVQKVIKSVEEVTKSVEEVNENLTKNYSTTDEIKQLIENDNSPDPCSWNNLTDKPFGEENVSVPFVPKQVVSDFEYFEELNVSINGSVELTGVADSSIFRDGSTANVVWDGVLYENLDIKYFEDFAVYYIGGVFNGDTVDLNTYPFIIALIDYDFAIYSKDTTATSHTLSISVNQKTLTPLDSKYLPDTVATKAFVEELLGVIENGAY